MKSNIDLQRVDIRSKCIETFYNDLSLDLGPMAEFQERV